MFALCCTIKTNCAIISPDMHLAEGYCKKKCVYSKHEIVTRDSSLKDYYVRIKSYRNTWYGKRQIVNGIRRGAILAKEKQNSRRKFGFPRRISGE